MPRRKGMDRIEEGEGEQEGMGGMEGKESVQMHKLFQRYVGKV